MKKILPIVMFLLMSFGFYGCGAVKLDISDYTSVTFSGFNGDGIAEPVIDFDSLEDAILLQGKKADALQTILPSFENSIKCEIDKSSNLSNLDTVKVTFSGNTDSLKKYGIDLATSPMDLTVNGLSEYTHLNANDIIEYSQEGYEPYITITYSINSSIPASVAGSIVLPASEMVKGNNGDTINRNLEYDSTLLKAEGILVDDDSYSVVLEGHGKYIQDLSEISSSDQEMILSNADDSVNTFLGSAIAVNGPFGQMISANGHQLSYSYTDSYIIEDEITKENILYGIKDPYMNEETYPKNIYIITYKVPIVCVPSASNFHHEVEFTLDAYYVYILSDLVVDETGKLNYQIERHEEYYTQADYDTFTTQLKEAYQEIARSAIN